MTDRAHVILLVTLLIAWAPGASGAAEPVKIIWWHAMSGQLGEERRVVGRPWVDGKADVLPVT